MWSFPREFGTPGRVRRLPVQVSRSAFPQVIGGADPSSGRWTGGRVTDQYRTGWDRPLDGLPVISRLPIIVVTALSFDVDRRSDRGRVVAVYPPVRSIS